MSRRRSPLFAPRRYYPGFFGALFLVLLRTAIGWHFLEEGAYKIVTTPVEKNPALATVHNLITSIHPPAKGNAFTSETYLRNSTGPFASHFRNIIPDVDARERLKIETLKNEWAAEMAAIGNHYGFNSDQRQKAGGLLADREKTAEAWFLDQENKEKVAKYFHDLDAVLSVENNENAMSFDEERAADARKALETDRKALVQVVDAWTDTLRDAWIGLATPDQTAEAGKYQPAWTQLDWIDQLTMWGLFFTGLCLMLGLFTPVAALGGANYLMMFYLSMPPFPGLPAGPMTEGHYYIVNKNMIEFFACLALAATPNGLWVGLDALLFGWIGRGKRNASDTTVESHVVVPATSVAPVVSYSAPTANDTTEVVITRPANKNQGKNNKKKKR